MLPTLFREVFGNSEFPREPEPDLVMDDPDQVAAYAQAGRIDGVMAAAYLFHSARISQVINGCSSVLDLACGPATQLAQVAGLNPDISFTGVDLSQEMLSQADAHTHKLGLSNVQFRPGDITNLDFFDDASFDAVISTMALHHLPSTGMLNKCIHEIARVLKPGGALYLVDFGRLKYLKSVLYFAYLNRKTQPHLFLLDYERSLRAAFLPKDFELATQSAFNLESGVKVTTTAFIPILVLVKSEDKELPSQVKINIDALVQQLPAKFRTDLNDIRMLFKFAGLPNDPFN